MAEEFEPVELEYSEEDIVYHIVDEDGNEVGFALMEDGREVEYYFEGYDGADFQPAGEDGLEMAVELEIDEDDILYYLEDEDGNEVGFVIEEDGVEIECYYEDDDSDATSDGTAAPAEPLPEPEKAEDHGYLYKMAQIAGHHGGKARDKVRDAAEKQVDKATVAVEKGNEKLKAKKDESDLGITREDVSQATEDLNVIAKEGAATVKELKGAYDDLMDEFGFLVPKKLKRRLPH